MISFLLNIRRSNKKLLTIFIDSAAIILAIFLSFALRLGKWYVPEDQFIFFLSIVAPLFAIPIFMKFDLYSGILRFIGLRTIYQIFLAISIYAISWGVLAHFMSENGIPTSVIMINWVLSLILISGSRLLARKIFLKSSKSTNIKRVVIYGAGSTGRQLMSALIQSEDYEIYGFIDESKELQGNTIDGLRIWTPNEIEMIISDFRIDEVLVAIEDISTSEKRKIINFLSDYDIEVKVVPSYSDLSSGRAKIADLREPQIEDLLGRDQVMPNKVFLERNVTNKVVLITGAGGSIGSELSRQILKLKPKKLILLEHNELALYSINHELMNTNKVVPILGSVTNFELVFSLLKRFKVNTVYHAAAYKHVPMVEFNSIEGIKNNVFGTLTCVKASVMAKVNHFLLISTDKAVRPTNIMGVTKRISELVLQAYAQENLPTKFSMVRFGNVLNSSGSVIPLFKSQINEGGPVTVTHKEIIRYFMTINEAVELVIQAGAVSKNGAVCVLEMGEPVKIFDLAKNMIRLSGLKLRDDKNPDGDIEIKISGLRPGEKLYEELIVSEKSIPTEHPMIKMELENFITLDKLETFLVDLKNSIEISNYTEIRKVLKEIVPEYTPNKDIVDYMHVTK